MLSPAPTTATVIHQTQKWLSDVIIQYTLCPFAKREHDRGRIHYEVIETADLPAQLEQLMIQCAALDQDIKRETTLLIFPSALSDFEAYLDMLDIANALLKAEGYEGIYQLASFHPDYCFAGPAPDDPSHYTNRSPYPMLHILREASVEAALKTYPNPETIPIRNIELTQQLGLEFMRALLADCYD
ncbi:DUF1415 domain-containing protein [Fretibacter rubidus]|uniref:DUF1415 domain-containing protein n=1 Tax=Fretibacter rubidus TaxID=570162 RepID=UPI00352AB02C